MGRLKWYGVSIGIMAIGLMLPISSTESAANSVCEGEIGAAYGLCVAYCEAMNCDDPENTQSSDTACDKIAEKYERITDLPLPCEEPLLPVCGPSCNFLCVTNGPFLWTNERQDFCSVSEGVSAPIECECPS